MTEGSGDSDWTPVRRSTLAAATEHLLPLDPGRDPRQRRQVAEAVARFVRETLANPGQETQRPFVLAALDELHDLAARLPPSHDPQAEPRGFSEVGGDEREQLLRQLEADSNPYLSHGLALLLQISLEGFFGDPRYGANPGGLSWTALGLTPLGPRRRVATRHSTAESKNP